MAEGLRPAGDGEGGREDPGSSSVLSVFMKLEALPQVNRQDLDSPEPVHWKRLSYAQRLRLFELQAQGTPEAEISHICRLHPRTVQRFYKAFAPTSDIAQRYLQAKSFKLAERVYEQADVDQAIEVLRDPSIGVLTPKHEQGSQAVPAVYIGIQATSSSVSVQAQPKPLGQLPEIRSDK